ncbi:Probable component of the lipoprotein assembly complex (forms a complex with YaeT, YfgL, and NlpB) [hydrothermal vent metagenome]|uniref:Probable component of the lipoprotein assembly complex (Forms a complex with YaeT, YfgL, and NlpB) n=1 Tax=hydrothermal vent metagenome TaxID=652676 RepID=A0A1W1C5E5_9ZZZZ
MKIFILIFILLNLNACFWNKDKKQIVINQTPKMLFKNAKEEIKSGSTEEGIKLLKSLQITYPNSKYNIQSKLEIAYALLKNEDYEEAHAELERFIKFYPNHKATAYAYYLRAVIYETKSKSILDEYVTDKAHRDIRSVSKAYRYYVALIKKYPNSKYSEEAKNKLIILRNVLARHELYVANFYTKQKAYIAAINRAKYIIENFPKTPSIPAALVLLERNYKAINATKLANDAKRVLIKNYPKYKPHFE